MTALKSIQFFLASLLCLAVAACQSTPVAPAPVVEEPTAEADVLTIEPYKLGNGDRLRITVFGEPDLSGEFLVDGAGLISMPLIGEISAENLTVRDLQRDIEERFRAGYLNDPKIAAEVINHRPYYIMGEVGRPDEYQFVSGLTVLNAVAAAGGFTYRANKKVVYVRGVNEAAERKVVLSSTTPVRPGDTIRIGERIF